MYYATHLLDRRETIQRWPTVHGLKLRKGFGPCGERPTNLHKEFPKFRGSGTGRVKNDEPSQARQRHGVQSSRKTRWPGSRNTCSGKESHGTQGLRHLCERCKEAKAKRCEAGPVSPCNPGKGTNASPAIGESTTGPISVGVRQVQSLESTTGPKKQGQISRQDRPTGDVSKALRWIVTTSWSSKGGKKESLDDHLKSCTVRPFPLESTSTVLG